MPQELQRGGGGAQGLPTEARSVAEGVHRRAYGAMVDNLRLHRERRLVDLNSGGWNQVASWLRQLDLVRSTG